MSRGPGPQVFPIFAPSRTEPRINPGGSGHGGKGNGSVNGFGEGASVQAGGKIGQQEGPAPGRVIKCD